MRAATCRFATLTRQDATETKRLEAARTLAKVGHPPPPLPATQVPQKLPHRFVARQLSLRSLHTTLDEVLRQDGALVLNPKLKAAFRRELLATFALSNQTRIFGAGALKSKGPGGYFLQSSALAGENRKSINAATEKYFMTTLLVLLLTLRKRLGCHRRGEHD